MVPKGVPGPTVCFESLSVEVGNNRCPERRIGCPAMNSDPGYFRGQIPDHPLGKTTQDGHNPNLELWGNSGRGLSSLRENWNTRSIKGKKLQISRPKRTRISYFTDFSNGHICDSPQRDADELRQRHKSRLEIRGKRSGASTVSLSSHPDSFAPPFYPPERRNEYKVGGSDSSG